MAKKIIVLNCRTCPYCIEDSYTDSYYCDAKGEYLLLFEVDVHNEIADACPLEDAEE